MPSPESQIFYNEQILKRGPKREEKNTPKFREICQCLASGGEVENKRIKGNFGEGSNEIIIVFF